MRMHVKITGARELAAELQKKCNLDAVKMVVRMNGAQLQEKAVRKAPVDTGTLKRSIGLTIDDGGMAAQVEPTVEYAPYQEYGTRFMEAQPFVGPAFREQKEIFKRDLDRLVK